MALAHFSTEPKPLQTAGLLLVLLALVVAVSLFTPPALQRTVVEALIKLTVVIGLYRLRRQFRRVLLRPCGVHGARRIHLGDPHHRAGEKGRGPRSAAIPGGVAVAGRRGACHRHRRCRADRAAGRPAAGAPPRHRAADGDIRASRHHPCGRVQLAGRDRWPAGAGRAAAIHRSLGGRRRGSEWP